MISGRRYLKDFDITQGYEFTTRIQEVKLVQPPLHGSDRMYGEYGTYYW